ncbi:hypothetical protein Rhal01_03444 [Rubritalea halochordaticola]|uniref:RNA polymerase sigma-70 region 2 domain-containing protein n=1 Tax=Rubritalea halochordaticola TaxID=714537 RepID=A0ABP9V3L9_9BACT
MAKKKSGNILELGEFVRLLTEHQAVIRGYIRSLIPNASDVNDVLQNTNLALWERREDFEPGTNFKAWACAVARFRSLEHRNKMKKNQMLVFDEDLVNLLADEGGDAQDEVELERLALDGCLEKLSPKNFSLVRARYHRNITLIDYAHEDGRDAASLRVILNRIRSALRECIEQQVALLKKQTP